MTALRSKENQSEIFVIGNTHLYFKPDADHIRLLQGYYAVIYVHDIAKKIREEVDIFSNKNHPKKYLETLFWRLWIILHVIREFILFILQFIDNCRVYVDRIPNVTSVSCFAEILTVCQNAEFINWWLKITFLKPAKTGKVVSDFLQYLLVYESLWKYSVWFCYSSCRTT